MPFALSTEPSQSEVSDAVNYLLANFSPNLSADTGTGQIKGPVGEITGYLYKYMAVKYANSFDGSLNFSNSPTGRLYYGLRNNNDAAESSNPSDYVWYKATGGFGSLKFLWYIATGGRQIQFAVSTTSPDTGWVQDSGGSIDLDVVTSGNIPIISEQFLAYFTPAILQVPRSGSPLTPSFTGIRPTMYATDKGTVVPFTDAQTDSNVAFVNSSWRIGNSSTTGYGDISLTNITIGNPTDGGDYALWPTPTAMSSSPAYITVPVRYKNSVGVVTQAGIATIQLLFTDPGAAGSNGPAVDISGYTTFVQNAGGAFNPATATLSASYANVTSPTFSWSITGATPSSSTSSSVVVTPLSSATNVVVTLTVNGSNLSSPISKTINMPIVYDGAPGEAGSNGVMSAFPTIYQWTGSSTPPTRPTTTSTYTWGSASYTAPTGWYTAAPSNTTAGNYLWSITIPLNTTATTVTSTLDWTNTSYPIRAIAYNGANGGTGDPGAPGAAGAATFVVTRFANDSSAPSNAEVYAVIGRNPVAGDIVTVSYNNYNNATVYRFVTSWVLFTTYITGSLIVQNTITADKMVTGLMSADNVLTRGLTVRDNSGNILLAAGTPLNYSNITASSGWLNSNISISGGAISGIGTGTGTVVDNTAISISSGAINGIGTGSGTAVANNLISINSNGTLSGAGGGSVTPAGINAVNVNLSNAPAGILNSNISLGTLGAGGFAYLSQITSANATTYISGAAIGTAQVGVLTAGNIGANTIDASKIAANTITAGQISANTITADKMSISNLSAITANLGTITAGSISGTSLSVGTSPAVSGTTMTGAGAIINSTGTFSLGTATTNITYNGTALYLNGNIVANGNILDNAISTSKIANGAIIADKISVTNLSAITADLGTITAGSISGTSLSVGTSPAVSGTSMTGAGAIINTGGTFALGNSSTNISYDGSQMTLNGNVVATGNLNANAATVTAYTQLNSIVNFTSYATGDALSTTINTGGQPVLMIYSFYVVWGSGATTGANQFLVEMKIDGVAVKQSNFTSIASGGGASFIQGVAYLANPSSGNINVSITLTSHVGPFTVSFYPVTSTQLGTYFYVLGTKR
jgi:hypothetical protein